MFCVERITVDCTFPQTNKQKKKNARRPPGCASHDHQSSTPATDKSAPRHDMKDVLAFNRPSFSRLIRYEDSGCVSRSPVKRQLAGDLISGKLNILKRKEEKKKKRPQSFRAEEDIRGAARFCWKCRGGPLVITEVNMPGDTLTFDTAVFAAVY